MLLGEGGAFSNLAKVMKSKALFRSLIAPLASPTHKKNRAGSPVFFPKKQTKKISDRNRINNQHRRDKKKRRRLRTQATKPLPPSKYRSYIHSKRWARKRRFYFSAFPKLCASCSSKDDLQLHHITYQRLGCERPEDLIMLCKECHEDFHEFIGITKRDMIKETAAFLEMQRYERETALMLGSLRG